MLITAVAIVAMPCFAVSADAVGALMHSPVLERLARDRVASWLPIEAARIGGRELADAAAAALRSENPAVRARAAFVLGEAAQPAAVARLLEALKDPDRDVRLQAGVALCRLGNAAGIHAAAAALGCSRPWLKYYAIVGLWRVGTAAARKAVAQARADTSEFISRTAEAALATWDAADKLPSTPRQFRRPTGGAVDFVEWAIDALIAESDWWWHRGNYDQCIRCNSAVTFLDPHAEDMYTNSAWLLWSMGRHSEAIGMYHRCIAHNPTSGHGPFYLGFYYLQHGDLVAAEKYLRLAVANDPRGHLARRALAHCLEKQGRLREAVAQWNILKSQRPGDGSVLHNLKRLKRKLENASAE